MRISLNLEELKWGVPRKTTDDDARSDTFKDRIDMVEPVEMPDKSVQYAPVLKEIGYYSYFPVTKENSEKLKKTVGIFPKGFETQFVMSLNNDGRPVSVDEDEFFGSTVKEMEQLDKQEFKRKRKEKQTENA